MKNLTFKIIKRQITFYTIAHNFNIRIKKTEINILKNILKIATNFHIHTLT